MHTAADANPGPWIQHSRNVARGAEIIAAQHPSIESERAYIFGLLHDIGRQEGISGMRHVSDGYHFLASKGYEAAARICLTHSYPIERQPLGASRWDGTAQELEFINTYLASIQYDDYDRLIQLCDAICLPSGFCLMEKRFVDVALRHGTNEDTIPRWKGFYQVKQHIERTIGTSIYGLLPGVVENTFGFSEGENSI